VLSAEGLVRTLPNKGATVVRVTHKEVEEAVPILGALEALAGELACARIDKERLDRIRSTQRQMVEHFRRGESQPYRELSRALYEAIFEVSDNKTLSEAYSILQARLSSLLLISPKSPPQWAAMVEDHEQMLAALEAGDGARFAQIARGHIRHKAEVMHMALDMLEAEAANVTDRHEQTDHCPVNVTQNAHQRAENARWCVEPNSVEMGSRRTSYCVSSLRAGRSRDR
jgi:DNA-binding GntR family transcriptional regulator